MSPPRLRSALLALLLALPLGALGASGLAPEPVAADPLAGYPEGSYVLPGGGIAVPLGRPTPADYTPAIHEKVLAAAEHGRAYDPVEDVEVPLSSSYVFIRPGAWMWSPSWCTMNFIYGTPGQYKIGSAGHCNAVGQDVVLVIATPTAGSILFVNIGKTEASHNNGIGDDWSITAIRSNMQAFVDPNVALVQGPQGTYTGNLYLSQPLPAKHFGNGLAAGTGGTARAGVATFSPPGAPYWYCDCLVTPGDSGGPMLVHVADPAAPMGQALGVITHLVVGNAAGTSAGTRLTAIPYALRNGDIIPTP